jgi:hypothetical protein
VASSSDYPEKYKLFNDLQTKNLSVVVKIDGLPDLISMVALSTRVRYGDPGINYGTVITHGALRPLENVRDLLSMEGSLTISQKIEPESGRGSISTLSLSFIDNGQFMTQLCAPTVLVEELLGNRELKVFLGYQQTSFPEDYFVIFRGIVTNTTARAGKITLQVSDANFKRRTKLFYPAKTKTTARLFYNSGILQTVLFKAKSPSVVVNFNAGGSGGTAIVSVSAATINVLIESGVTTAGTIKDAIEKDFTAQNLLIKMELIGNDATPQTAGYVSMQTTNVIPVAASGDFFDHILGPNGSYDPSVRTWIKVEDEFMEYGPGDVGTNNFTVLRGAPNSRLTEPEHHEIDADVSEGIELEGNVIDLALKLMLSGWNGYYKTGVGVKAVNTNGDPLIGIVTDTIFLPDDVDADLDLGLVVGDYVTIVGGVNAGTYVVNGFRDVIYRKNRGIRVVGTLISQTSAPGSTLSLRSQYDTFPVEAGLEMNPALIDINRHRLLRSGFLSGTENRMRIFQDAQTEGKAFIEDEFFKPIGAYSLTRFGRVSVGLTLPPIASDKLVTLDADNVLDPETIGISRGLNSRRFYNEIDVDYNYADNLGRFTATLRLLDIDSLNVFGQNSILPIKARGVHSDLGGDILLNRRARFLLQRFKGAAFEVDLSVNWGTGSIIEAGDVVLLRDEGGLQISNFATGERDLGLQLFEVIDRSIDIKSGRVKLKLLSNLGFDIDDRYATISPSSELTAASTASVIVIRDSFGAAAGVGLENDKWTQFIGLPVVVHSYDWTVQGTSVLGPALAGQPYSFTLATPLGFTPLDGYILDVAAYPTDVDPLTNRLYKLLHAFIDVTATVVTGISTTQFTVSAPEAAKFQVGLSVLIHNASYSILSKESKVDDITGVTVTLATPLAFTPAAGQKVELIGFADGAGAYRFI